MHNSRSKYFLLMNTTILHTWHPNMKSSIMHQEERQNSELWYMLESKSGPTTGGQLHHVPHFRLYYDTFPVYEGDHWSIWACSWKCLCSMFLNVFHLLPLTWSLSPDYSVWNTFSSLAVGHSESVCHRISQQQTITVIITAWGKTLNGII